MQALIEYPNGRVDNTLLPADDGGVPSRSFDRDEERLQCFIEASRAAWCGCGAIFDATIWNACPCCAGNSDVYAVPLMAVPRRPGSETAD